MKLHVRDAREETKRNKPGEIVTEIVDERVSDKRLFAVEPGYASVLRVAQRQGSTLLSCRGRRQDDPDAAARSREWLEAEMRREAAKAALPAPVPRRRKRPRRARSGR